MRVTPLTRETPNAKILTNVGISTASGVVPRRLVVNQIIQKPLRGSVSQVENRKALPREWESRASGGQGEALGMVTSGTRHRLRLAVVTRACVGVVLHA